MKLLCGMAVLGIAAVLSTNLSAAAEQTQADARTPCDQTNTPLPNISSQSQSGASTDTTTVVTVRTKSGKCGTLTTMGAGASASTQTVTAPGDGRPSVNGSTEHSLPEDDSNASAAKATPAATASP